jgi:hypothetical protein
VRYVSRGVGVAWVVSSAIKGRGSKDEGVGAMVQKQRAWLLYTAAAQTLSHLAHAKRGRAVCTGFSHLQPAAIERGESKKDRCSCQILG